MAHSFPAAASISRPGGIRTQPADGATSFEFHSQLAQTAERGLFDAYFLADGLAIAFGGGIEGGNAKVAGFEPVTLFSALAPLTKHLGFIATASTTYEEPYSVARKFASLDLISGGRAGWNVVTTATEAGGAQLQPRPAASARRPLRARARACRCRQEALGQLRGRRLHSRQATRHLLRHRARSTTPITAASISRSKGPLNVPRSPQGHPVIVQAGQSDDGRGLAAATAEVIFTAHQHLETAQEFYRDIKARARGFGRDPSHVLIMPGVSPFVGRTEAEAREKYDRLTSLIVEEDGLALINGLTGGELDLKGYDLDGPLPPAAADRGHEEPAGADPADRRREQLLHPPALPVDRDRARPLHHRRHARRRSPTRCRNGSRTRRPTASTSCRRGCRPALDDFVDLVIPELQRRGLFRTAYEGRTLRENLGLPFPVNRMTAARAATPRPRSEPTGQD